MAMVSPFVDHLRRFFWRWLAFRSRTAVRVGRMGYRDKIGPTGGDCTPVRTLAQPHILQLKDIPADGHGGSRPVLC